MHVVGGFFYNQYLNSQAWKIRCQFVRERAGYRCEGQNIIGGRCNKGGRLEVHHLTYVRLGKELFSDLIALCEDCHTKWHGTSRTKNQMELPFAA